LTMQSGDNFPFGPGGFYRVRIRAVNTQGPGVPSAAVEVSLPASAPGEPHDFSAVPGDGSMTLNFRRPSDNGREITGWAYTTDNGVHWKALTGVSGDWQLTATITDQSTGGSLAGGVTYQVRVHAINELGPGDPSQTRSVALPNPGSPAAPGSITAAQSGEQGIGVDFAKPGQGDSAIIKYQYSTDDGNTWRDAQVTGDGPLHAELTMESGDNFPFGPGHPYRIRVRAVNTQGPGLPSAAAEVSLPASAPGGPHDFSVVPGDGSMTLNFGRPSDNGREITGWEYTTDNGVHWKALTGVSGDWQLSATITDQSTGGALISGVTYQVRVQAVNEFGPGDDSQTVSAALPNPGSPAAPGSVTAAPSGEGGIGVDFAKPGQGDSAIIKYQ
jgi:predicted phage tail protein